MEFVDFNRKSNFPTFFLFFPPTRIKIQIFIFIFFLRQGTIHPCRSSSTKQCSECGLMQVHLAQIIIYSCLFACHGVVLFYTHNSWPTYRLVKCFHVWPTCLSIVLPLTMSDLDLDLDQDLTNFVTNLQIGQVFSCWSNVSRLRFDQHVGQLTNLWRWVTLTLIKIWQTYDQYMTNCHGQILSKKWKGDQISFDQD